MRMISFGVATTRNHTELPTPTTLDPTKTSATALENNNV